MTAREARNRRREEERKANKLEKKRLQAEPSTSPQAEVAILGAPANGFVSHRAEINRRNAQHSTGPRSSQGKVASSRNSLKHGLSTSQVIIPGEDPAAFESFLQDLLEEHQPANPTEELLVNEMAQSYWLQQRAIRLQTECFTAERVDEKRLSLFLRYQTTHSRGFHKALNTLLKLQKERKKAALGFVSQKGISRAPEPGFVRQNEAGQGIAVGFASQNRPSVQVSAPFSPAVHS